MKIPLLYLLSHIILGFISYYYNKLVILFLIYQFIQYYFNIRFFLLDVKCFHNIKKCYKKNNNILHTSKKITQFIYGYLIAFFFNKYVRNNL